jgi:zinc transporter ZupT
VIFDVPGLWHSAAWEVQQGLVLGLCCAISSFVTFFAAKPPHSTGDVLALAFFTLGSGVIASSFATFALFVWRVVGPKFGFATW